MNNKPIPLKLLAVLHILMPLFSLVFNALVSGLPITQYAGVHWNSFSGLELLEFYAFSPLAGLLILSFSAWGYYSYLAVVLWNIAINTIIWKVEFSSSLAVLVASNLFNVVSFVYMLSPAVRKIYTDKSLHWWNTPKRFLVDINEVVINNDVRTDVSIRNLSKGGALLLTKWSPAIGENLSMCFSLGDFDFSTEAKVVHAKEDQFGVQFLTNTDLIQEALEFTQLEPMNKSLNTKDQFKVWMGDLKQGRGLFPNL
ncbi:MAG: PilZ domain-containing protein [Bdellovibrionales bacterium]|nr:PilZ domain-containing protein [Bdellovibrionales bacterium]